MKIKSLISISTFILIFSSVFSAVAKDSTEPMKFNSIIDSLSYCMGIQTAMFLSDDATRFNYEAFKKGLMDANSKKTILTDAQVGEVMRSFMDFQKGKIAKANRAEAIKFLLQNRTKPGVKTTTSGLEYEVLKEGTGPHPKSDDVVKVQYHGTLLNGEVFDSSVQRGQPIEIALEEVIPGWAEGIPLMTVGSKYKFYVSPELAYGEEGSGPIGPNQCLIYEIELIDIVQKPAKASE